MNKVKILIFCLIIIVFFIFNQCSVRVTGYDYLINESQEGDSYGLYSYILFSQKPNSSLTDKYIKLLEEIFNKMPAVNDLQKYYKKENINIVCIPLNIKPPDGFDNLDNKEKSIWIIDNYDYTRSQVYLSKFINEILIYGPYIISYKVPLSKLSSINEKYIIQNITHAEKEMISLWVDEFLKQSVKQKYWERDDLEHFVINLRNAITVSSHALFKIKISLIEWKKYFEEDIALKE